MPEIQVESNEFWPIISIMSPALRPRRYIVGQRGHALLQHAQRDIPGMGARKTTFSSTVKNYI
jgi:hypothetical protein